jgi:hypothetical protein
MFSLIFAISLNLSNRQLVHQAPSFPVLCAVLSPHFFPFTPLHPFPASRSSQKQDFSYTLLNSQYKPCTTKHIAVTTRLILFILSFPFAQITQFCDFFPPSGIECENEKLQLPTKLKPPPFDTTLSQSYTL